MASETIRPDADTAIGSWTDDGGGTTSIYQSIDEATASDTDYIKTENNPTTSSCEIGFAAPSDTTPFHGRLSFRYRKQGGRTADLTVRLKKGTQVVQEWSYANIGTSWVQADEVIFAEIDDWSDIRVVFIGNQSSGGSTTTVEISWAEIRTAVVESIGATGRDRADVATWESNIDNTTYPDALSVVEGQCYADSDFDEEYVINAAPSNVIGIILTTASGERHDGTAGTGVANVLSANPGSPAIDLPSATDTAWYWQELDFNGQGTSSETGVSIASGHREIARNLVHDVKTSGGTSAGDSFGYARGAGASVNFHNNFTWNVFSTSSGGGNAVGVHFPSAGGSYVVLNSTTYRVEIVNGASADANCFEHQDGTGDVIQNNIGIGAATNGSGTAADFDPSGTYSTGTASHNLSSDTSAPGTDTVTNSSAATNFVSTSPVDLHLKSGADAIDAGTDLGVTPAGVNLGMPITGYADGYDRDADPESIASSWDLGAAEFLSAGGTTINVGLVSETNTPLTLTANKQYSVGLITETGLSRPLTAVRSRTLGLVTETDTAFSVGSVHTKTIGLNTETDTSFSVTSLKTTTLGLITETDIAFSVTVVVIKGIGLVTETDSALAVTGLHTKTIGLNTETDTPFSITTGVIKSVGLVTESDTAFGMTGLHTKELSLTTETDTSFAVASVRSVTLGLVTETDTAFTIDWTKTKAINLVSETDLALSMTSTGPQTVIVSTVFETDTAFAFASTKEKAIGLVTETDSSLTMTAEKARQLGLVFETDTAFAFTVSFAAQINQVTESDTAFALAISKVKTLGLVLDSNTALTLDSLKTRATGQVSSNEQAFSISPARVYSLVQVSETDLAQQMEFFKSPQVRLLDETDEALPFTPPVILNLGVYGSYIYGPVVPSAGVFT